MLTTRNETIIGISPKSQRNCFFFKPKQWAPLHSIAYIRILAPIVDCMWDITGLIGRKLDIKNINIAQAVIWFSSMKVFQYYYCNYQHHQTSKPNSLIICSYTTIKASNITTATWILSLNLISQTCNRSPQTCQTK